MPDIWKRLADCRAELEAAGGAPSGRWRELLRQLDALAREGRQREEESVALLREAALVISATSAPRVLELALDAMIRLSGAQRGFILLSHADGAQEVAAARNMERGRVADAASEISRRVVGAVLADGKPVRLEDALHTAPFSLAESVTRLKLLSVLCAPIRAGGRIAGALYLENRKATGTFTEETERLVAEFAETVGAALRNAEAFEDLRLSRDALRAAVTGEHGFEGIEGRDRGFCELLKTVATAAKGDIPILIEGESGTGKELIARAVHLGSPRRERAFVSVNCAALPHSLLESELFGHTRGAFTGAVRDRRGLFSTAHGGTIFLDEIGEMAPELQGALLRVLQSGEYRPVGSDQAAHADVRVVAATKRSLDEEVRAGRFREDLFFRLNGVRVRVPPLRERREDIPLLIGRFLEKFKVSGEEPALTDEARACLMAYDYPGNVRELETVIRRAVLFARQGKIGLEALPPSLTKAGAETLLVPVRVPATGAQLLAAKRDSSRAAAAELERAFLLQALALSGNRPGEAARRAGMNRSQFEKMLSRHGLSGRPKDEG
ncbi:MAG: sigma-54 interaction domain-containing protein [Candidatus Brocadiia bacterium]